MRPRNISRRFRTVAVLAATLSACAVLITIGYTVHALQTDLLNTLDKRNLSLVEIGSFSQMRVLLPGSLRFASRKPPVGSLLIGVSEDGDRLLISANTGLAGRRDDRVFVATVDGQVISTFYPNVRGMTVFYGELSPDQHMIAFGGALRQFVDTETRFGLHSIDESGVVQTLVETTEPETPTSIGWARDGKSIVYDSSNRLFLYHLDTNTSTFFAEGNHPTWSPDGRWIAYRRPDRTAVLAGPDRTTSKNILDGVRIDAGLRWSPDSNYLLFTAGGMKVLDLANGRIATVFVPVDQFTEIGLRWVRELPK